jgi:hypothetical protein
MPHESSLVNQLESRLSGPYYQSMFYDLNKFRTRRFDELWHLKPNEKYTPIQVARATARTIVKNGILLDPVDVVELSGPLEFFRAHDGGSTSRTSAGTLGRSWVDRHLVENLWASTAGMANEARFTSFIDLMRSSCLVLKEWNAMTHLACMQIPEGCRVVVVRGNGNWKAMLPKEGRTRSGGTARVPDSLAAQISRMNREGVQQYVVALFNPGWVFPVVRGIPTWPFPPERHGAKSSPARKFL